MTCQNLHDLLDAYLDGELGEDRAREVDLHLASCPACRRALEEERRFRGVWAGLPVPDPGEAFWDRFPERWAERAGLPREDRTLPAAGAPRAAWKTAFRAAAALAGAAALLAAFLVLVPGTPEPGPVSVLPPPPTPASAPEIRPGTSRPSPDRTFDLLRNLAGAPTTEARRIVEAVEALGPRARSHVFRALREEDPRLVRGALAACGALRLRGALSGIRNLARRPVHARAAVAALVRIDPREARAVLRRMLDAPALRPAAVEGATRLGDSALAPALLAAFEEGWTDAPVLECFTAMGKKGEKALVRVLEGNRETLRSRALFTLSALKASDAWPAVARLLKTPPLRRDAIRVLGDLGEPAAVEPLVDALANRTLLPDVRAAVARIGPDAVCVLESILRSRETSRKRDATSLLGVFRDERAVKALGRALADPALRREALLALGRTGHVSAVPCLVRALGDRRFAKEAIEGLGRIADRSAVPALLRVARVPDLRAQAIRVLGRIGDPRAVPLIVSALSEDRTRSEAIEAAGWIGDPRAVPPLIRVLADRERRGEAREALVRIVGEDPGSRAADWVRWWRENRGRFPAGTGLGSGDPAFVRREVRSPAGGSA